MEHIRGGEHQEESHGRARGRERVEDSLDRMMFAHSGSESESCRMGRGWLEAGKGRGSDFLGWPVVRTSYFPCRGHGFNPWSGN